VYAAQFRPIQNNQKLSTAIGSVRLDNLPAGQSREISYRFFRQHRKTEASFRFKVVAETIAYTEKSLPPVSETYSGQLSNVQLDAANNRITGLITNQGSVSIPKPVVQISIASKDAPDDFHAGGGAVFQQCLATGASLNFVRPISSTAFDSIFKVALYADEINLSEKILGGTTKTEIKAFRPVIRTPLKYKPRRQ